MTAMSSRTSTSGFGRNLFTLYTKRTGTGEPLSFVKLREMQGLPSASSCVLGSAAKSKASGLLTRAQALRRGSAVFLLCLSVSVTCEEGRLKQVELDRKKY